MKQGHWTAHFYRWFVAQPRRVQDRVLKLLDQGYQARWDESRQTYVFTKP